MANKKRFEKQYGTRDEQRTRQPDTTDHKNTGARTATKGEGGTL